MVSEQVVVSFVRFGVGFHADQDGFDFFDATAEFFRGGFELGARDELALQDDDHENPGGGDPPGCEVDGFR